MAERSTEKRRRRGRARFVAPLALALCAVGVMCACLAWQGSPAPGNGATLLPAPASAPQAEGDSSAIGSDVADGAGALPGPGNEPGISQVQPTASVQLAHDGATGLDCKPDVVLVQLAPDVSPADATAALADAQCVQPATVTAADVEAGFMELALADGYGIRQAARELADVEGVEGAQPNFVYRLQDEPAAPAGSPDQASLAKLAMTAATSNALSAEATSINDTYRTKQWALDSVGAYEAWDLVTTDKQVTVAVIDSGCKVNHEDLQANIVATYDATGADRIDDVDAGGHGTHVAGIIAAEANNARGVAGVSYNAGLLPIRIIDDNGLASTSTVVTAYRFVMEHAEQYNVKVANLSVGATVFDEYAEVVNPGSGTGSDSTGDDGDGDDDDDSDLLLIQSVIDAYDAGIITTCSAGNDSGKTVTSNGATYRMSSAYHNYPSDWIDCALSVIALEKGTPTPKRASYSNYNVAGESTKDIAAPGSSIYSTLKSSVSSYGNKNGTSMAAPCVAGIAALVFAANPALTPAQVTSIICDTATDLGDEGWDDEYAAGEVNAAAAVATAREATQDDDGNGQDPTSGDGDDIGGGTGQSTDTGDGAGNGGTGDNSGAGDGGGDGTGDGSDNAGAGDGDSGEGGSSGSDTGNGTGDGADNGDSSGDPDAGDSTGAGDGTGDGGSGDNGAGAGDGGANGDASQTAGADTTGNAGDEISPEKAAPHYTGASQMPVGSTCTWELANCTIKPLGNSKKKVQVKGATVTAISAGTAKIGVYDAAGTRVATKTVKVKRLTGTFAIQSCADKKLRISLTKLTSKSNAPLSVKKRAASKRQRFRFKAGADGAYLIVSAFSYKALSVKAGSTDKGARIVQRTAKGAKSQLWRIVVDQRNRLTFVNVKSGKVLGARGIAATIRDGKPLVQKVRGISPTKKWTLES